MTFPLAEAVAPLYHRLAPEIARLLLLGLSRRRIAKALGVDDKTVAKALARSGPLP
jgi:transposase-like protein